VARPHRIARRSRDGQKRTIKEIKGKQSERTKMKDKERERKKVYSGGKKGRKKQTNVETKSVLMRSSH
jgi:hypothetical protein